MNEIHVWADNTFGSGRRVGPMAYHLRKEAIEVWRAEMDNNPEHMQHEIADCFILVLNMASKSGLNFEQLKKLAEDKMEINKNRQWGEPDENGVVEHLRTAQGYEARVKDNSTLGFDGLPIVSLGRLKRPDPRTVNPYETRRISRKNHLK